MIAICIKKRWDFILSTCLFAAIFGCGSPPQQIKDRASASGRVTFNGRPLPAGTVGLESAAGQVSTAIPIKSDGTFSTDRAPIGKSFVTVDTTSIQVGNPGAYVAIPEKYNNPRTSGLSLDVQPGENNGIELALQK